MIKLCVLGPRGRMGRRVLDEAAGRDDVTVVSVVDRAGSELIGREVVPGVEVTSDPALALAPADVYIDFTTPATTALVAREACARDVAAVIGTTGLDEPALAALDALSQHAPVLTAANFSLGVNLLAALAERAARALGPAFDMEVVETHHRHKRDAPSGTALELALAMARGRGHTMDLRYGRDGEVGPRSGDEIGVMAVRGGDVAGEHTAYFFGPSERLEITHRAGSRSIFAAGALHAAAWLTGQPAGRYRMGDVLGL